MAPLTQENVKNLPKKEIAMMELVNPILVAGICAVAIWGLSRVSIDA